MLRHVVMWKLAASDPTERVAQAQQIADRLNALQGVVPEIAAISAGPGMAEGDWHAALIVDVADRDALASYAAHPAHQKVLTYIRSVVAERAAVDFEF
jgi:hypothetical protein